jgi:hypothetical protein
VLGVHPGQHADGLEGLRAWLAERGCGWPQRCGPRYDRAGDPWRFSETPLFLVVSPEGEVELVTWAARAVERYLFARRSV